METGALPSIGGIVPNYVWITGFVLYAVFKIYNDVIKARQNHREEMRYRANERLRDAEGHDITDVIADKVMAKMEPRLKDIETKLKRDKNRLESHEIAITNMSETLRDTAKYQEVSCQALLALLDRFDDGSSDNGEMVKAKKDMTNYLLHRRVVARSAGKDMEEPESESIGG